MEDGFYAAIESPAFIDFLNIRKASERKGWPVYEKLQ